MKKIKITLSLLLLISAFSCEEEDTCDCKYSTIRPNHLIPIGMDVEYDEGMTTKLIEAYDAECKRNGCE